MNLSVIMKQILVYFLFLGLFCNSLQAMKKEEVEELVPQVIKTYPHDTFAFTQGLCIHQGYLYESTGLYGESSIRKIDLKTLEPVHKKQLPDEIFAEGIAIDGDHLIQLTWKEHAAFVYDLKTLNLSRVHRYQGEGWGICCDGKRLFMSNGTDLIVVRDSQTFQIRNRYSVTLGKRRFFKLNALACVGNSLYANIWQSNFIVRIDKRNGRVTGLIDASGLLTPWERLKAGHEGVLNGIAYHPARKTFFITGKYWPWLFEVKFVSPSATNRDQEQDV